MHLLKKRECERERERARYEKSLETLKPRIDGNKGFKNGNAEGRRTDFSQICNFWREIFFKDKGELLSITLGWMEDSNTWWPCCDCIIDMVKHWNALVTDNLQFQQKDWSVNEMNLKRLFHKTRKFRIAIWQARNSFYYIKSFMLERSKVELYRQL